MVPQVTPKFRPDIIRRPFDERDGGRSFVLEDPVGNKFFRISDYEFELLRVLDGTLSIEQAVDKLGLQGRYFSPDHATALVNQFSAAGLLLGTGHGSARVQAELKNRLNRFARRKSIVRLYFLFIPLINPDRFLEKTVWLWRLLVNRFTGSLFALLMPGAVYLVITNISRLADEFLFFFNIGNLLVLWIAIALVKLVHEFSHAYTAKNLGLRVPEMGVAFLLFFPCLYCNTTTAWQLAGRKERMSIALAGVMSEAMIAVISVYVWYFSQPGLVNSIAFWLMAISVVSSLLFNGNPLMKFDGYFVMIDWLRMPNLQARAFKHLRFLFLNGVLGIESAKDVRAAGKETLILTTYGVSAFVYRIFLYSGIVMGVYLRFDKTVGALLGLLAFVLFIVKPLATGTASLIKWRSQMRFRPFGVLVFGLMVGGALFLLTRPWSQNSVYPCYVESAKLRKIVVPAEAPVSEVLVREGARVRTGRTIFKLDPTRLSFDLKDKELEKAAIEEEISNVQTTGKDLSTLPMKYIALSQAVDAIKHIRRDMDNLEWKAPFSGFVTGLLPDLQPGAQPEKGTVVGQLAGEDRSEVLGLIPGVDILRIEEGAEVEVWFPFGGGRTFTLTVKEISPFNREDLKDSPFSSRFGGEIATEVKDRNQQDLPLETHYICRMDFGSGHGIPLGMTGRLVVHLPPRSTLERIVDAAHQTFRREIIF